LTRKRPNSFALLSRQTSTDKQPSEESYIVDNATEKSIQPAAIEQENTKHKSLPEDRTIDLAVVVLISVVEMSSGVLSVVVAVTRLVCAILAACLFFAAMYIWLHWSHQHVGQGGCFESKRIGATERTTPGPKPSIFINHTGQDEGSQAQHLH
jgi:hypothetical protein